MGLLQFFFGKRKSTPVPFTWPSCDRFRMSIVGESNYQPALTKLCGGKRSESAELICIAVLNSETDNAYDPLAVRVEIKGQTVGYLHRQDALLYRSGQRLGALPEGPIQCRAIVVGGWDRGEFDNGMFGVRLDADFRPSKESYPCPYCKQLLSPTPSRTKACIHCGSRYVVRNSQPITAAEAEAYDAIISAE